MTTAADIRQLVQPLLKRNPDMALAKKFVFFKPFNHLIQGIFIDRVGRKYGFQPKWCITCAFEPLSHVCLTMGTEIFPEKESWNINRPGIEEEFANRMEGIALPNLRNWPTIEAFANFHVEWGFDIKNLERYPIRKLYVDLALGRLETAENALRDLAKHPHYWLTQTHTPEHFGELMTVVLPMVIARDRAGIAALLHGWEAETVKRLKLEKYWEPSPFPVELTA